MLGDKMALAAYQQINDNFTVNWSEFYNGNSFDPDHTSILQGPRSLAPGHTSSGHTSLIAPNGDAVSSTSSINYKWAWMVLNAKIIPVHMDFSFVIS